jgi:hypothetical protein
LNNFKALHLSLRVDGEMPITNGKIQEGDG